MSSLYYSSSFKTVQNCQAKITDHRKIAERSHNRRLTTNLSQIKIDRRLNKTWSQIDPKLIKDWSLIDYKLMAYWLQIDHRLIIDWLQIDSILITDWSHIDYKLITWITDLCSLIKNWCQTDLSHKNRRPIWPIANWSDWSSLKISVWQWYTHIR